MGVCPSRHDEFFKKQFGLLTDDERNPYERKYIDETIGRIHSSHFIFERQDSNFSGIPEADQSHRCKDTESSTEEREPRE